MTKDMKTNMILHATTPTGRKTTYSGQFRNFLILLLLMMTAGAGTAWGEEPVEITTADDITNNTKKLYLIQTNAFKSFYIAPQENNTITTNNILGDDMLWYFLDAGTEGDTQYYYIVNNSTEKYICHGGGTNNNDTSRGVTLADKTSDNDERCKFYIELDNSNSTTDFYNIDAKGKPSYYGLNKRNGSETNQYPIRLTNDQYIHDVNSKWKFIRYNGAFTWPEPPFTPSTDSDKHYYKIRNIQNNSYYVSTDETPDKVTYASTESDHMVWYLKEASSDSWFKYYYIANPSTGDRYMYYNGTATNGSNQTNAISVQEYNFANDDRYQFVVVQAAKGDGDNRVECYAIIPKLLTDKLWGSNSIGLTTISEGANMGIISSRGGNYTAQWIFENIDFSMKCAKPVFTKIGNEVTISCAYPTRGVTIFYTKNGGDPSSSSTEYTAAIPVETGDVIKAIAIANGYENSDIATKNIFDELTPIDGKYHINSQVDFDTFVDMANTTDGAGYHYVLNTDIDASSEIAEPFTGTFEAGIDNKGDFYTISGLNHALFNSVDGGTVKNVMLKDVQISQSGNVGAIAGEAGGYSRIYNCGILPTDATNSNPSTVGSSNGYCGGLVGYLKDDSRVINCFSYANITDGTTVGGIVGYNQTASTAAVSGGRYTNLRTAVVNCMFYGDITGGTSKYPVYGGAKMLNNAATGINNYDFYRAAATFTPTDYNCSWPASEENLTRFEYYRYLLNSNRELCGWWVKSDVAPSTLTTAQVQAIEKDASLMAKWVLDPSIAPYPILKSFGTYPSVINPDAENRINPTTKEWVSRVASSNTIETNKEPDTEGQTLGSVTVSINAGSHHNATDSRTIPITAMDIDNNDFCYGKIQLPYYNEIFGNPDGTTWSEKYGDNYTDKVVTGWDITSSGGSNSFVEHWETGYNFADRNSTDKDRHRVFAQGGYYYVPYGVTSITITAHWADAYYLSNTDRSYERVYLSKNSGTSFAPAGTRSNTFGGQTVSSGSIQSVLSSATTTKASTVYDCAIVLVGNYQYRNGSTAVANDSRKPFTLMTVDLDFDNEPDYCFEWQIGAGTTRAMVNPVRFDFLPVVELGVAMKEDNSKYLYAIGKLTPYGHFEVTETAIIHMGQFEYENENRSLEGPVILNNGVFDQICRGTQSGNGQHINYFIVGGHVRMPQFTPGAHVNGGVFRHCAVNVLGGEFAKFFLSGNFTASVTAYKDNPHCYIDGGKLDFVASGGKEQIDGNVFWKIDHSYITEFYGGGINSDKPVTGSIDITIDRSRVSKFCGGPQFGDMTSEKTVTTSATGTTFGVYYGAGNGGTCYSQYDQSDATPNSPNSYNWENGGNGKLTNYTALKYRNKATGYHAKYELEMINSSAGTENNAVCRTYMYAAQFATTNTGNVTSTLTDCEVEGNFFGGGLLGGVSGNVTSTLKGNTVVRGSVFGAGYGIADLTVDVLPKETGNTYTAPIRNENTAVITPPVYPTATTYYWTHDTTFGSTTLSTSSPAIQNPNGDGKNYLYTEISLDNLGTVTGNATLNIQGNTEIYGNVFGGGDEGAVSGNTTVNILP